MACPPELIGHPSIQQQTINHRAVVHGPPQILGLPNAECFPEEEIGTQGVPQLQATLRGLLTMELQHLMPPCGAKNGQLRITGVGHHQDAKTTAGGLVDRGKQRRSVLGRQPTG